MSKPGWKSAMIVFHDTGEASGGDLAAQRLAVQKQRQELLEHLEQASAIEEVELPPATPLPSLLVEGSERALAECLNAPSVKEVLTISGDIPMKGL
jgi:hypothetical protein